MSTSGNVHYHIHNDTIIYALVDSRAVFDALPLPPDPASNDNVLVKCCEFGPHKTQMIYQYWLLSPLTGQPTQEPPMK